MATSSDRFAAAALVASLLSIPLIYDAISRIVGTF